MNIKELAEQAGWSGVYRAWINTNEIIFLPVPVTEQELKRFAELVALAERNRCISIIENYQIHVGASTAGEIACELTYSALRQIRDEINGVEK